MANARTDKGKKFDPEVTKMAYGGSDLRDVVNKKRAGIGVLKQGERWGKRDPGGKTLADLIERMVAVKVSPGRSRKKARQTFRNGKRRSDLSLHAKRSCKTKGRTRMNLMRGPEPAVSQNWRRTMTVKGREKYEPYAVPQRN